MEMIRDMKYPLFPVIKLNDVYKNAVIVKMFSSLSDFLLDKYIELMVINITKKLIKGPRYFQCKVL